MLDILGHDRDPCMFAVLVYRKARCRKIRVGESTHGHRDDARPSLDHISDGRSTVRAETVGCAVAAVGDARPRLHFATDLHLRLRPSRLGGKGAAATLLTFEAMAHRDAHRFTHAFRGQLSTTASRHPDQSTHVHFPSYRQLEHTRRPAREQASPCFNSAQAP